MEEEKRNRGDYEVILLSRGYTVMTRNYRKVRVARKDEAADLVQH